MPIFSGAILDRFSRKRMIYTLDFISSGVFLTAALILSRGWFSFSVLVVGCLIIGSINSIYMVAYQSFYPMLITPGNYSKAYSIASVLETLSAVMIPVATFAYNKVGITPLLAANAVCFLVAAIAETQIKAEESYIQQQKQAMAGSRAPGVSCCWTSERASSTCWAEGSAGGGGVFHLQRTGQRRVPGHHAALFQGAHLKTASTYILWCGGRCWWAVRWADCSTTRCRYPGNTNTPSPSPYTSPSPCWRALTLHACAGDDADALFVGVLGVTSYTIRISATQSYVPHEKKGRFNGAFNMLNTVEA